MILGVYLHFRNSSRAQSQNRDDYDHDSSSISTLDQVVKQWMVAAAKCDYTTLFKMLRDDPRLAKAKDFTSGYTALHWACKHGNLDLVKLLVCLHLKTWLSAVCLHFQLFVYILGGPVRSQHQHSVSWRLHSVALGMSIWSSRSLWHPGQSLWSWS